MKQLCFVYICSTLPRKELNRGGYQYIPNPKQATLWLLVQRSSSVASSWKLSPVKKKNGTVNLPLLLWEQITSSSVTGCDSSTRQSSRTPSYMRHQILILSLPSEHARYNAVNSDHLPLAHPLQGWARGWSGNGRPPHFHLCCSTHPPMPAIGLPITWTTQWVVAVKVCVCGGEGEGMGHWWHGLPRAPITDS